MLTRIITGAIGIVVAAYVIQTGGVVFAGAVLALMFIGWYEFTRALNNKGTEGACVTGAIALGCLWYAGQSHNVTLLFGVSFGTVLVVLLYTVLPLQRVLLFPAAAQSIVGIFYLGWPLTHLIMLRNLLGADFYAPGADFSLAYGAALVWLAFIATWCSDSFAYFVGSAIGKHKLAPSVSPNKTIEGFLGSLVGTSAVLAAIAYVFALPVCGMAVLGACLAIVATLGDLVESAFKRYAGIKDSGNIIPGHGGVLDRFDSVFYTVPTVYYFVILVGIG